MNLQRKPLIIPFLILLFAFTAAGCSQKAPADVRIELETPDGSDVSDSNAVFPKFVSKNEDYQKELDKLNKEVDYNLMTLACKKSTCEIITSKEALKSHEIDGITLSTNVAKLYEGLGLPGILKETEMQGFETDENAEVTAIFMKLITQIPDPSNPDEEIEEQHFFYYDLTENTLSPLSEHGYDFP